MRKTKLRNKMAPKKLTGFAAYLKENKAMPKPLEEDIAVTDLWQDNDFEQAFSDVVATKAHVLYGELTKAIGKVTDWMTPSKVLGDEKQFVKGVVDNTKDETFAKKTDQFKRMIADIEKEDVRPTKEYYTKAMSKFLMAESEIIEEAKDSDELLSASDISEAVNKISKMGVSELKEVNTTTGGLKFDEVEFQGFDVRDGSIVGVFTTKNDGKFSYDYFVIMDSDGELEGVSDY